MVRKHFVDERIRTLFTSYMHVITTENVPGAGIVFPAIFSNIASFSLPVGGARDACRWRCSAWSKRAAARSSPAPTCKEITCKNGRATGVKLADGRTIEAKKIVASAIDFPGTLRMAGEELFPEPVREKAKGWHWGNHSLVTLHLALKKAATLPRREVRSAISPRAYNIFFGMDDIEEVEQLLPANAPTRNSRKC